MGGRRIGVRIGWDRGRVRVRRGGRGGAAVLPGRGLWGEENCLWFGYADSSRFDYSVETGS